eukprot:278161_1
MYRNPNQIENNHLEMTPSHQVLDTITINGHMVRIKRTMHHHHQYGACDGFTFMFPCTTFDRGFIGIQRCPHDLVDYMPFRCRDGLYMMDSFFIVKDDMFGV